MIISRAEIRSAVAAYRAVKRKSAPGALSYDTDSFERSEHALTLAAMAHDAALESFYRDERVDDLHRRIAEGRYFVPTEEIVDKLLGRLIVEFATA